MSEFRMTPPNTMQSSPRYRDPHLAADEDIGGADREAVGWIVFGGVMMVLAGAFQSTMGLVALVNEAAFMSADDLPVGDYSSWGWTHLIVGVLAVLTGVGLIAGWAWARWVGIVLAGLSALLHVGSVFVDPIWSIAVIVFDFIVIYTLAVHGDVMEDMYTDTSR